MTSEMFEDVDMSEDEGDDDDDSSVGDEGVVDETDEGDDDGGGGSDSGVDDDGSGAGTDAEQQQIASKSKAEKKKKKAKKSLLNRKESSLSKEEVEELESQKYSAYANLYKVQIKELLSEISVGKELRQKVLDWVESFKEIVSKVKPSKSFLISECEQFLKPIPLPLPLPIHPNEDTKGDCQWEPPVSVEMVGAWANGTAVGKISKVDVALVMPNTFLNKSDFLNHKYHVKRAIYLAYLAKKLSGKFKEQISFGLDGGNPLRPVLEIQENEFRVQISAVPPPDFFKVQRFTQEKNNLRYHHFFGKSLPEDEPECATPNYNFTILADMFICDNQISNKISETGSYRDTVKLLKVWLEQRSLRKGFGSFSGFLASALLVYLDSIDRINKSMNSYEVLRIVLLNLTQMDLTEKGKSLRVEENVDDWHLQFDVVLLDATGQLNYASEMSKFTYKRVQFEARRALKVLNEGKLAGFHALFTSPVPFLHNFDHILQISDVFHIQDRLRVKPEHDPLFLNNSGYFYPILVSVVGSLIEKCLGKRAQLIDSEIPPETTWQVSNPAPQLSKHPFRIGLVVDREAANKAVEKCESEDPIQAQMFKDFWGEISQLRRFKDGTMCETVIFVDKTRVCFQMLSHILSNHLGIQLNSNGADYLDFQVERLLDKDYHMLQKLEKPKKPVYIKGKRKRLSSNDFQQEIPVRLDEIANKATGVFDEVSKILRSLTGLPLEITTVQGASSILRFTNVCPTPPQKFFSSNLLTDVHPNGSSLKFKKMAIDELPPKVPKVVEPISVVLHLETSGKWPDNVKAIDRLKCAFLIRIGQLLKDQFGLTVQPHSRYLDVCKEGFVFRIKLTYFRELTLLKQQLGSDGILRVRDNVESQRLEKESLLLPQLTSTLHSFHREYAAFGTTCRLAKRWLASHLLLASPMQYNRNPDQQDCRFSEESVELLVAHLFMDFAPYLSPPNEAQLGFLRFLHLISKTDWRSTAIILNFHEKLTSAEVSAVELDFVKRRDQLPCIFICTPDDKSASVWTKPLAPVTVNRAKVLASRALILLEDVLVKETKKYNSGSADLKDDLRTIFRHDESRYDVLIKLKKEMNPRRTEHMDSSTRLKYMEYSRTPNELMPIVDFDPVQLYLQELRDTYGHLALFLHDTYGGSYIAVVWKPDVYQEQNFSVSHLNCRMMMDESKTSSNIDAVLEGFQIIGKGIVDKIETKWKDVEN